MEAPRWSVAYFTIDKNTQSGWETEIHLILSMMKASLKWNAGLMYNREFDRIEQSRGATTRKSNPKISAGCRSGLAIVEYNTRRREELHTRNKTLRNLWKCYQSATACESVESTRRGVEMERYAHEQQFPEGSWYTDGTAPLWIETTDGKWHETDGMLVSDGKLTALVEVKTEAGDIPKAQHQLLVRSNLSKTFRTRIGSNKRTRNIASLECGDNVLLIVVTQTPSGSQVWLESGALMPLCSQLLRYRSWSPSQLLQKTRSYVHEVPDDRILVRYLERKIV